MMYPMMAYGSQMPMQQNVFGAAPMPTASMTALAYPMMMQNGQRKKRMPGSFVSGGFMPQVKMPTGAQNVFGSHPIGFPRPLARQWQGGG